MTQASVLKKVRKLSENAVNNIGLPHFDPKKYFKYRGHPWDDDYYNNRNI